MASELTFQFKDEESVNAQVSNPPAGTDSAPTEAGPLLSLCLPTYNRAECMRQQFLRMLTLSTDELSKIEIIVSDNCSPDETEQICRDFGRRLPFRYLRNTENVGPDDNFLQCLREARGRYVWLLGDDDFLRTEHISPLLQFLSNGTYGLIHIDKPTRNGGAEVYDDIDRFVCKVGVMITFMSSNIFRREPALSVDYTPYRGTHLLQVPMYLEAAMRTEKNVILHRRYYDAATMNASNGGYNIMKVFVKNLSEILDDYEERGLPPHATLVVHNKIGDFIFPYIFNFLILHKDSHFDTKGAKQILNKYLGMQRIVLSALKFFFSLKFLRIGIKKCGKLIHLYGMKALLWLSWIVCPPALVKKWNDFRNAFVSFRFSRRTATPAVRSYIEGPVTLRGGEFVHLGTHFSSRPGLRIEILRRGAYEPALVIGDNVTFNFRVHIGVINRIEIGNNVLVGSDVLIIDHSHGHTDETALLVPPNERPLWSKGAVRIGNNVWIGEHVIILPGVSIGEGAVIGAGSVVTHDIPAYARAAGNPARILP